ncbi:tripartite ATP-independent transporter DctM subunit [Alkalispirillum mobile]|uniref:Tripartite ATP-independent transporter DctM subunit n=1 Tax=Alkalispirillum mobile TaxID=85925 RepID=A0A498C5K3_9GAMM|nr:TRAP transporter large permease subunit [Alkalispirillum mobile]RLK51514.1 tripartite ATP-independent transporter DctM subunit [Alkalispirillum mobile]
MEFTLLEVFLPLGLFVGVIVLTMLGYPVALTLPGTAIIFALVASQFGLFDLSYFGALPTRYWGVLTNEILIAVPLFVFMGVMLQRSKIADALLETMGSLFGSRSGGLALSTIFVAALLAASTGIVGATVITMGLISLPAMMKAGYDNRLSTGLICASGSLAQVIPPSTVLIFLAVILQGAYSEAQMAQGNFAPDTFSVGDIFAGALIPSLLIAGLYSVWVAFIAFFRPEAAPPLPRAELQYDSVVYKRAVNNIAPALLLIFAVLGSIIGGIATPTESAAVGAVGAIVLTMVKVIYEDLARGRDEAKAEHWLFIFWLSFAGAVVLLGYTVGGVGVLNLLLFSLVACSAFIAVMKGLRSTVLGIIREVSGSSLIITCMVFTLFLGASVFSLVFARLGGEELVQAGLSAMPGGQMGAIFVVLFLMFFLGFFLDPFEIIFIVIPAAAPALLMMGVEPIWLAIMVGIVLQTSYLTPPFGFSLFFLRSVAPPEVRTGDIYRGIVPFVGIQLLCLAGVWMFPDLVMWLPKLIG